MDTSCGRIPRKEVKEIARMVMKELEVIQPGCSHTIAGGYDPLALFRMGNSE